MSSSLIILLLVFPWLLCVGAAMRIGERKNSTGTGFMFGLFFGPLGVIMAACLDERPNCPRCGGKLNKSYKICQHCNMKLYWHRGLPLLPKEYKNLLASYANQSTVETPSQKFDEWGKPL